MKAQTVTGELVRVTWTEGEYRTREATLEVRHADGSMTMLVVEINRMSNRIPVAASGRRA